MKQILYGDGIHDDYPAIQELLDSQISCVYLPAPSVHYTISSTLRIHSNQQLKLDAFTRIVLADQSNCSMLENAEPESYNSNICVDGGIWDMNHRNQWPNPYHFANPLGQKYADRVRELSFSPDNRLFIQAYSGHCFRFNSIHGLIFRNITLVNPVVYGAQFAYVDNFTVENITFDYTEGSPKLWNMDGVHFEGGCKNGVVRNLKGACHDDLVAITSDDSINGDIENISVDNIMAEGCHSAVRMLSVRHRVRNIHISNVYGSYYVYCICMTKYYDAPGVLGHFENISLDHIYASFCKGTIDVPGNYGPLIHIGQEVVIPRLSVHHLIREEAVCPTPTMEIEKNTEIGSLYLSHLHTVNRTAAPIDTIVNGGTIRRLTLIGCSSGTDRLVVNNGVIEEQTIL